MEVGWILLILLVTFIIISMTIITVDTISRNLNKENKLLKQNILEDTKQDSKIKLIETKTIGLIEINLVKIDIKDGETYIIVRSLFNNNLIMNRIE